MKTTRLIVSDVAAADIVEQAGWYEAKAGVSLGPAVGESGHLCGIAHCEEPELWDTVHIQVNTTPRYQANHNCRIPQHLIFYRFSDGDLFVLRVVHGARDLERLL